jgi:hypothetical protein
MPRHKRKWTVLKFEDLNGQEDEDGDGILRWTAVNLIWNTPAHEWIWTSLRFENPDGSPGTLTNLKWDTWATGATWATWATWPQGPKGDTW